MSDLYDLQLDTDVVHDNGTTYASLLDQNKIDLFSDEHIKERENFENLLKRNEKEVLQCLFRGKAETTDTDYLYKEILFQKPMVIDRKQSFQTNENKDNQVLLFGTIILVLVFSLVMIRYMRHRKKMEEIYNEGPDK